MDGIENQQQPEHETEASEPRRVIKRYSNRKLYDTKDSRYVTLLQIAEMVRAGEEVQIIDNATKEDKTDVTLALIISEELKTRPRAVPVATLKALIRHRGTKILTQLRDGPIGKWMPHGEQPQGEQESIAEVDDVNKDWQSGLRKTLEQWQHTIDERIRTALRDFSTVRELEAEIRRLSDRVANLEHRLGNSQPGGGKSQPSSNSQE